ncbi:MULTISPECIES: MarR family winged helix-turn-helix transcriptional regulator [unclassified Beijerinckia]|uniref:MarR family winged helix-turn-helix transcriptional regulator n=1 Tax=unclassified Beijerinckia TaxID=2638183 RepID=UPI00089D87FB|nr:MULTISPECIES: MarR family winged helix-turn-helix transcriptional regulator [unclassified Beijerinckia]MDH7796533.1 DNA-binding MarR family transcriptional regulator [Beijerinckia sp. GAS462]SEC49135.1 DNA-binding transcriptional regulator, MarR family [Beijerinckia sp. 28-YEA-48]
MATRRLILSEFLPYRLSITMQAVSEGLATRYSHEFGITVPEWRVISALGEHQEMTARDIALHARMNKTMVSRAVATLLQRNVISRRENSGDRREAFLKLARRGHDIYAAIVPMALDYERKLLRDLPKADIALLDKTLTLLLHRADEEARAINCEIDGDTE